MGEIIIIGVRCQFTLRPFLFPIGSLDEFLIPISPLFTETQENHWSEVENLSK
jgi:hypothetical protein